MPINAQVAKQQWERYVYCRDNGHHEFHKLKVLK